MGPGQLVRWEVGAAMFYARSPLVAGGLEIVDVPWRAGWCSRGPVFGENQGHRGPSEGQGQGRG